jgi:hypothetical protein
MVAINNKSVKKLLLLILFPSILMAQNIQLAAEQQRKLVDEEINLKEQIESLNKSIQSFKDSIRMDTNKLKNHKKDLGKLKNEWVNYYQPILNEYDSLKLKFQRLKNENLESKSILIKKQKLIDNINDSILACNNKSEEENKKFRAYSAEKQFDIKTSNQEIDKNKERIKNYAGTLSAMRNTLITFYNIQVDSLNALNIYDEKNTILISQLGENKQKLINFGIDEHDLHSYVVFANWQASMRMVKNTLASFNLDSINNTVNFLRQSQLKNSQGFSNKQKEILQEQLNYIQNYSSLKENLQEKLRGIDVYCNLQPSSVEIKINELILMSINYPFLVIELNKFKEFKNTTNGISKNINTFCN